jgi:DNA-binding NtrC family response regulator
MTGADINFAISRLDAESLLGISVGLLEGRTLFDTALISAALRRTKGCQVQAARMLRVHRNTLTRLMDELALPRERSHWR